MENSAIVQSSGMPMSQINLGGVIQIPAVRQVMLLVGVAAAVAAGFTIFLWSQTPSYSQLYGNLDATEAAQVIEVLQGAEIDYKMSDNGSIMVPDAKLHDARMQVAGQGLAQSSGGGMNLLQDQSSFGVSQFMENARYQHALEAELARTITSLGAVREARVHLALPKQTAFLRDQKSASASVLLQLGAGGALEADQAAAIVNLVASSVPNLTAKNVTVIDQYGRMLSSAGDQWGDAQAVNQFKHAQRLEDIYTRRIQDLLTPLVGPGRVRAQVVASLDFTVTEETRETYDPASTALRSEQISEERRSGSGSAAEGIPGALSNQPPETAADTPETSTTQTQSATNSSRSSTRNFEVDRTISHVRPQSGTIQRLSVAVLVDDSPLEEGGDPQAFTTEDIDRFTTLVKEAVGFDESRGDTVVVVNAAFRSAPALDDIEEPPFWENPAMQGTLKQILGALLVLALGFGLVRPLLGKLLAGGNAAGNAPYAGGAGAELMPAGSMAGSLPAPSFDDKISAARNITGADPARVAQVVRKWVSTDE
ncbi:flagellar basal-body MS-ring/collar protein FliF [Woeseia oceani]|uniref:Flagellar M-ring protein n=1 Tax=Woeseia oceani TaxID=1548547 RepID=A0A193LF13_9GAMM|nr:flagellar basal-body MS-ring/collar protein FliF [Woeseia oceani]ANO51046.1 flagellar M-ring protein FliF [Woeseia oceani]